MCDTFDSEDEEPQGPSRSQIKREAEAQVKLARRLLGLTNAQLSQIEMPDELRHALADAKAIKSNIAGKRQLKFVGKMMRGMDTSSLLDEIELLDTGHQKKTDQFHHIEQWRDRLINSGDQAFNDLMTEHPHLDRQLIRQLIRNAHKEERKNRPLKSQKGLFRYLREMIL
ncbi:MAG: ribosome biogenesis factor YjgA [Mariprofundaceae bacterium]